MTTINSVKNSKKITFTNSKSGKPGQHTKKKPLLLNYLMLIYLITNIK